MDLLKSLGMAITELPQTFTPHRQIKKVYEQRRHMIESGALCCHSKGWKERPYA